MEEIQRIISTNPSAEEVNLEGRGLSDLGPLIPSLSRLPKLKILKLANNVMRAIPSDLSALNSLIFLDISQNPISSLSAVLPGFSTLPALRHLFVDLPHEADEDEVIVQLPNIQSFNGTPLDDSVDEAAIAAIKHGSANSGAAVATGNGRSAPAAANFNSANASHLTADLQARLGQFNSTDDGPAVSWTEGDMADVQRVYDAATTIAGWPASADGFATYSRDIVRHLQRVLAGEDDGARRKTEVLQTKKVLFEYCFEEVARAAYRFDSGFASALTVLQETYGGLLRDHHELMKAVLSDRDAKLQVMRVDMQHAINEIQLLVGQLHGAATSGAGGGDWDAEKRGLVEEIGWLRTENEKLSSRLRQQQLAREKVAVQSGLGGLVGAGSPAADRGFAASGATGGWGGIPGATLGGSGTYAGADRDGTLAIRGAAGTTARGGAAGETARGARKELTRRQLLDLIEDVYASKSKFDIRASEGHLPRETMEQHLYTYLNQRYGLKSLILDWAQAITAGLRRFRHEENDVAVFERILKNEIDEEFRFVQRQLKETVFELLRVYLKGKHPLKSDDDVAAMCRKRLGGFLHTDEWVDIVKYMYNGEDTVRIIPRVKSVIKDRAPPTTATRGRRPGSGAAAPSADDACILYTDFLKILLDFQLEGHERFLGTFVRLFRTVDADRNGVLNEGEFKALLHALDGEKTEQEVASLVDLIDPHSNQHITFSECVTFLSAELVKLSQSERVR